jgi:hypothetical protein
MEDKKTLNQWFRQWGYSWVEGKEFMLKHELTASQAINYLNEEHARGNVIKNGN